MTREALGLTVRGLPAGLHAMLDLPDGTDEAEVVRRAADRGRAVEGLTHFAASGQVRPPALVVGYATPPQHAYTSALARLAATLADVGAAPTRSLPL